ncbi:MAG: Gfo/Idh/MocA family oxidoreductase [Elusimicrobiota bacterium]|jgi:predicted dehydrogenase
MNFAIIGCGRMGEKRAAALGKHRLVACCDIQPARAHALASKHPGCEVGDCCHSLIGRDDVDAAIVCTTHDLLARVTLACIKAGKHVLVEKPGARSAGELEPVLAAARRAGVVVKVGFNHRFHPALWKAKKLVDAGALGELMFVRGRYGHGGRLGYEKEWRADPTIGGGGELLDQGMHLIDLSRWFLGDLRKVEGFTPTYFWNMPVEDNAFLLLRTKKEQAAWLHVSWTEWKNTFSYEVYGRKGKLVVDGIGGSYGPERLTHYRMGPDMKPPKTKVWEFPGPDASWAAEFQDFLRAIRTGRRPCGDLQDAYAALQVVAAVYKEHDRGTRRPVGASR